MKVTCGVFFINNRDEVLICHASHSPLNEWTIPKGHKEKGESDYDTALREMLEETNIDLSTYDGDMLYLGEEVYQHKKKKIRAFAFVYGGVVEQEIKCNAMVREMDRTFPEIDEYKWVSFKKAKKLLHYTQVILLKKFESLYKD